MRWLWSTKNIIVSRKSQIKKNLVIVGCGEHARCAVEVIEEQALYNIFGFVTNSESELGKTLYGYPVLCLDDQLANLCEENKDIGYYFLGIGIASGSMLGRLSIYQRLDEILAPSTVIAPESVISRHAIIGEGIFIEPYVRISNGVKLGDHCIVQSFTAINHDQTIGDNVLIGCNVAMAGSSVGSHTTIADGSTIGFKKSIGSNCLVTDGTVVTKDIPDNVVAYGNPARTMPRDKLPTSHGK